MTKHGGLILTGLFLMLFLAALDQTIVATALPRIVYDLHGEALYAWVATGYLLFATVSGPVFGRLSELVEGKRLLAIAILIFLSGSAACGLAPAMGWLIAARTWQGIGGGAIFALIYANLGFLYTPRERGRVQGYFGGVFGIASVVGPFLGGYLTEHASWRWIFYLNMPLGVLALLVIWRTMPNLAPSKGRAFDPWGAASLAAWTVPLVLGISWAGEAGTIFSWTVGGLLALAAAGLVWFIWQERRHPSPLVDLGLFRRPVFRWTSLALLFYGAAFLSVIIFLPLYLVQARHVSASHAGLLLTPLVLGVVTTSVTSGRLASRLGRYKVMLLVSLGWFTAAVAATAWLLGEQPNLWLLAGCMVLVGLGLGPGAPLFTVAVQNGVPPERIGTASSMILLFRLIGQTAGAAAMGSVLAATLRGVTHGQILVSPAMLGGHQPELAAAVSEAIRRIYWLTSILGGLALLTAFQIPDAELRGKNEGEAAEKQAVGPTA